MLSYLLILSFTLSPLNTIKIIYKVSKAFGKISLSIGKTAYIHIKNKNILKS